MATPVEYRHLGTTGLKVSVPILGAMHFGDQKWMSWILNEEKSLEILKAAWDRGINTIDTANIYSNGESERIIGKFIQKFSIPRSQIIIATKCYHLVANEPELFAHIMPHLSQRREYVNQSGLSRAAIFNAVEASLQRLGTSYIDLLQIHRFDPETPAEETMRALHDLVTSGKVRYIGASSMRCWQFAYLNEVASKNGWTKFVSMQNEYSLLYREEEREMFAYCKFHGIGIIPWAPLNSGVLCRPLGVETPRWNSFRGSIYERKFDYADVEIISRVQKLAEKKGKTMAQIALAWVIAKVTSPIVGITSLERLDEDIITGFTLSSKEVRYLEMPYIPKRVQGHL